MVAVIRGELGYMGIAQSFDHHISVLADLASLVNPALTAYAALGWVHCKTAGNRVVVGSAFLISLLCLVPQGRRPVIYAFVLIAMALALGGVRLSKLSLRTGLLVIVSAVALFASATFFMALRESVNTLGKWGQRKYGLSEYALNAMAELGGGGGQEYTYRLQENLRERMFLLGYFSDLLAASWHVTPLHGDIAAYSAKIAVPSVLYPDKARLLQLPMEEAVANPRFGLPVYDASNSMITSGVSDFGVYGVFLYPLVIVVVFKLVCRIATKILAAPLRLLFFLLLVALLLQTENTLSAYIVFIRDTAIVLIAASLLWKLPSFNFSPRQQVFVAQPGRRSIHRTVSPPPRV